MASIDSMRGECLTPNCSKSVNSCRTGIFFQHWHLLGLSDGCREIEEEFVAADPNCTMGVVCEPEILENRKFHGKLPVERRMVCIDFRLAAFLISKFFKPTNSFGQFVLFFGLCAGLLASVWRGQIGQ